MDEDTLHALGWVLLLGFAALVVAVIGLPVIRGDTTDVGGWGAFLIFIVIGAVVLLGVLYYRSIGGRHR